MWSFLLLCSCMHIAVVVAQTLIVGHRGERVDIRCPYESGYESNSKYLCKGKCTFGFRDIIVRSGSPAEDERFSLTEDTTARVFTVSITDLRTEDEGQYWCAVDRTLNIDVYSEILLLVKEDERSRAFPTISLFLITSTSVSSAPLTPQTLLAQTSEPDSDSFVIIIIITAVGLVLLLISAVFLVVAVRKKKQTCGLVSFFTEELHVMTRKAEENAYEKGNPAVVSNSHTAQSDDGSASNEFHRPANTETVDTDLDYMNVAAAERNAVDPDQIYTELNSSRQSDVYQSLRTDSVQEESIYHSIGQTLD
ncbi:CMRF35-like molecule 3 [Carassius auratus]|uniref:CMRF35-like molecule 3 n=1 Tax=Carassius auratus TaxID=7957 RepID=A0A6P6MYE8_CARAU|nr:CMRF35-like molecule 3 [Carassius auratus]